jgi:hypothetical protein
MSGFVSLAAVVIVAVERDTRRQGGRDVWPSGGACGGAAKKPARRAAKTKRR